VTEPPDLERAGKTNAVNACGVEFGCVHRMGGLFESWVTEDPLS
jgi:hypothetical protein